MSNKKIIRIAAIVLMLIAVFAVGFLLADKIAPSKGDETTVSEQTTAQQETTEAKQDEADTSEKEDDGSKISDEYLYLDTDEILGEGALKVTKAEYLYYATSIYNNLVLTAFQYDYYYGEGYGAIYTDGFQWKVDPYEQECSVEVEGESFDNYAEYIEYLAKTQLLSVKSFVDYARLNNITLSDKELEEIDALIQESKDTVSEQGMELEDYLKSYYGEDLTLEAYIGIVKDQYLVNKVDEIKSGLMEEYYTDEVLDNIFNSNKERYGAVTLRSYIIHAETDSSGVATKEGMKAAKAGAEVFAAAVTDEKSFKYQASEREKKLGSEDYAELLIEDSYTLMKDVYRDELVSDTGSEKLADWAFSESTKVGDTYIFEADGKGYGIYMLVEPVHKAKPTYTYDVRHILLKFGEEGSEGSTKVSLLNPDDYDVTVDIDVYPDLTADPALYMQAQAVLEEYLGGKKTEESFGELAKKYSADGNASEGGIYSDVTEGTMVSAFESWALEENREKGDVGIVETVYGYHVMYFVGRETTTTWADTFREAVIYENVLDFNEKNSARYELDIEKVTEAEVKKSFTSILNYYSAYMG